MERKERDDFARSRALRLRSLELRTVSRDRGTLCAVVTLPAAERRTESRER
jgi:hypothetical protein